MDDLDAAPFIAQIFGDQTPVAMGRLEFAAQQNGPRLEYRWVEDALDRALGHQREKAPLVLARVALKNIALPRAENTVP